jgi:hypothetical protein
MSSIKLNDRHPKNKKINDMQFINYFVVLIHIKYASYPFSFYITGSYMNRFIR